MRIKLGAALALVVLIGSTFLGSSASAGPSIRRAVAHPAVTSTATKLPWLSGGARTIPGQIVVVWRASASRADTRALAAQVGGKGSSPDSNVQVVRVGPGVSVAAAIRTYRRSPLVRFAEPDRVASTLAPPNDTLFAQQWGLDNSGQSHKMTDYGLPGKNHTGTADADVDAPEAWAAQTLHQAVVVAVIDSGVDINHEDLANSLWVNTAEQAGTPSVDDDGNGFIDDLNGWDFFGKDKNPSPSGGLNNSHGTHVAGVVAAERDNATGVSGVCGDCQVMGLRIGDAKHLSLGRELDAIRYAIRNGADVINLSLGTPVWSPSERNALQKAGDAGILVVAAAGNASLDNDIDLYGDFSLGEWAPSYPASYSLKNILSVAASNDRDQYGYVSECQGEIPLWRCGFTSWGHDSVDVAAPGVDILSTVKEGISNTAYTNYDVWDGTSMASPMVAGIAGLVRAENPTHSPIQVKNAIMQSVDHPNSLKLYTSWGRVTGVGTRALSGRFTRTQGRVNALAALTGSTATATPVTDGNIDGARSIDVRRSDRLSWPGDANDVYKKRLVSGRTYRVTLNGPAGGDFDLWVWKPGTKDIFEFTAGCFQRGGQCPALAAASTSDRADEALRFKAHRTGVFYIQVNGWYSGGRYAMKISRV